MARIYFLLFIVMASWGFNVAALATLVKEIDPITMTAFRILTAGIMVLVISKIMGIFRLPTKAEWKTIGLITIFNVVLHHSFLAMGLTKTAGVNAGIILGAAPLVTMVLSIIFLKNRVSKIRIIGFIAGFAGILFTSLAGNDSFTSISIGDGYIFLCMVAQAISFILIGRLNPTFDPRLLTGYMLVSGSVVIFMLGLWLEQDLAQISKLFSWKLGSIFLFSAVIATAVGHMIYNFAVKNVGPAETTVFVNLNTLFALIGSAIFLGEPILSYHFIGLTLIILGVFAGSGTLEYLIAKRKKGY
ncbi:MAG TPA: DMT family transporter [Pseudogracilibacillus sp.]|nr:DMT family transporter [Pseudogracilibacillus sp.]